MKLETLFRKIESPEFEAELAIASGSTLFHIILVDHLYIQELVSLLRASSQNRNKTIKRIYNLLEEEAESGFIHPNDIFIAAYLWALNRVDPEMAFYVAVRVSDTAQLWWGRNIAQNIQRIAKQISQSQYLTDAATTTTVEVNFTTTVDVSRLRGSKRGKKTHTGVDIQVSIHDEYIDTSSGTGESTSKIEQPYSVMHVEMAAS